MSGKSAIADFVGCYHDGGTLRFFPFLQGEIVRAAVAMERVIASFSLRRGGHVLTISLTQEVAQFAPFEWALRMSGLIGANADATPFDASRVESIVRQFDAAAVCGIDEAMIEGLRALGHDPAALLAGRICWARHGAFEMLQAAGLSTARRMAELGPMLALECVEGAGMHVDAREWTVAAVGGRIRLSSRLDRHTPIADLDTGLDGDVVTAPCTCGNPDPRVIII